MSYTKSCRLARTATLLIIPLAIVGPVGIALPADDPAPQVAPFAIQEPPELPPGTGFIPPPGSFSGTRAPMATQFMPLATRFDWREAGRVTPVKNQGSCGSCYAFASAACFESRLLVEGAGTFDFSENNIKECEWFGSSCGGGNDWIVANMLSTKGTVLESCDPYVAGDVDCSGDCAYEKTLLDWQVISFSEVPSVDVLKSYVSTYGPIYTTMYAGNRDAWYSEFQRYDGSYTLYHPGGEVPNHAVLIVGWDDSLVHAGGKGAWIVKNSWGTRWGGTCGYGSERGYFYVAYGSARMGSYSSFVLNWQDYEPDADLLYLDEGGYTGQVGYATRTIWGLCKYVPDRDWIVERVEFWTLDQTTDVDVYIYDDFDGYVPSNVLTAELDQSFALAGYHSVELEQPIHVAAGNAVYAVVKITDAAHIYPMAYDSVGPKSAGCCYISATGTYYNAFPNGDLGIRLRVGSEPLCMELGEAPAVTSVDDVPSDAGGYVNLTWKKSLMDDEESSPEIRTYKIWRRAAEGPEAGAAPESQPAQLGGKTLQVGGPYECGPDGSVWELVASVDASQNCCYSLAAPTGATGAGKDTCWALFYVSAHTGTPGGRYNSNVQSGFSVDNLQGTEPVGSDPDPDVLSPEADSRPLVVMRPPLPNPASEGFDIRFDLSSAARVGLRIYDVSGREVARLLDETLEAGPHGARWAPGLGGASDASAGIYFARIVSGEESHSEKLILTR